jgi:cytochrome c-type biogenesis protein CcmH
VTERASHGHAGRALRAERALALARPRFPFVHALAFALALVVVGAATTIARAEPAGDTEARHRGNELLVEEHLLAPCCWNQTLDIHESPVARELRAEIHRRVESGESAASIEDDFAVRYGERVRAIPRGHDPRSWVVWLVGGAMVVAAGALLAALARWRRRSDEPAPTVSGLAGGSEQADDAAYDRRLQDELDNFDPSA